MGSIIRNNRGNRKQSGFTLIELVITVTILGILASFAIPAYKDHTIKSRVSEASSIFNQVKAAYTIHYGLNGRFPNSLSQVEHLSNNQNDHAGDYIQWMRIQNNGRVRARTRNIPELGVAADKIMEFRPSVASDNSTIRWTVFSRENNSNWIPPKFLPAL
ncbi:MAG: prepilin-type N-terminal cleavage/methylation domain-containing protein [Acidiferrobacterales bacterium]|nr:prepilin-type N-terminal cleavage/methylation domain-containing protein [Acidiferrobacterales bacterium]